MTFGCAKLGVGQCSQELQIVTGSLIISECRIRWDCHARDCGHSWTRSGELDRGFKYTFSVHYIIVKRWL